MPPKNSVELIPRAPEKNEKNSHNGTNTELQVAEKKPVVTALVVVPPDGGWGWVVMFASFCCNVIVDGIVFSAGSFQKPIAEEFGASKASVALVSSLLSGFYLLAGPFVSALANRFGFRPVTIAGAFIASAAFGISYFATSIGFLYITYGIIGGIGFCFIYMPSVITVGYYFEKWRALATGISLCGSGVGTFVFAPLSAYLINECGWRGALLCQAAIILLCVGFGACFRPLKPVEIEIDEEPEEKEKLLHEKVPAIFTKNLPEGRFSYSVPNSNHNTWIGSPQNSQYPTAAEVFRGSNANLERRSSGQSGILSSANINSTTKKLEQLSKAQKRLSGQSTPEEVMPQPLFSNHKELKPVGEDEEENEAGTLLIENATGEEVKPVTMTARRHTVSGRRPNPDQPGGSRGGSKRGSISENRPMYRDDIFFSGSLVRIPQYQSQTSLAYHMSVTRMPTKQDVIEVEERSCKLCPESVRRTLATMLDVSLLKSPSFMLLAFSGFFTMMGFFVPFMFIADRAKEGGMDEGNALMIVSAIGISNTIARIVCGVLSSFKGINALHINNVAITIGGLATIFSGYALTEAFQFTYAGIFGIAIGEFFFFSMYYEHFFNSFFFFNSLFLCTSFNFSR